MSLIIKGMEMPQAGDVIICGQIEGKLQCTIVTRDKPTKWCKASEISTPHGRLIDVDKLVWFIDNHIASGKKWVEFETIKDMINSLPTIIEAEVSE